MTRSYLTLPLMALLASAGCLGQIGNTGQSANDDTSADDGDTYIPKVPFVAIPPSIYVAKVKNVLTGQAATLDEVTTVENDPTQLGTLVDQWFATPEAQIKMRGFYGAMFQTSQVAETDLGAPFGFQGQRVFGNALVQQFRDSFPLTVQDIVGQNKPFSETLTTNTIWMTPPIMAYYLLTDDYLVADNGTTHTVRHPTDATTDKDGNLHIWFVYDSTGDYTINKTLDRSDTTHFMHFGMATPYICQIPQLQPADATHDGKHVMYDPPLAHDTDPIPATSKVVRTPLQINTFEIDPKAGLGGTPEPMLWTKLTQGTVNGIITKQQPSRVAAAVKPRAPVPDDLPVPADVDVNHRGDYKVSCPFSWTDNKPIFDFTTPTSPDVVFRPVTIEASASVDATPFWDVKTMRNPAKATIKQRTMRNGFFSTPAFLQTFPSNDSNQARGLTNQALVVALGKSINPVDKSSATVLDTGKDGQHSDPNSPCFSCHQTLDPMRNVMLATWTYAGSQQLDATQMALSSTFDFFGVTQPMSSMNDFASALASHPLYPTAIVQKLCYYASSAPCSEDDDEFQRIAQVFKDSNFNFATLMRELLSSPIITGASETRTLDDRGEIISIARYNHMCAALTERLDLTTVVGNAAYNMCSGVPPPNVTDATVKNFAKSQTPLIASNIPADTFTRGASSPVLATDPSMFFRSSSEALCQMAASFSIDLSGSKYASTNKDAAIDDFVTNIMGVTATDPAFNPLKGILENHYDKAIAAGATPTKALQSTLTLACTSPTSVSVGL